MTNPTITTKPRRRRKADDAPAIDTPVSIAAAIAAAAGKRDALLAVLPRIGAAESAIADRTFRDTLALKLSAGEVFWQLYVASQKADAIPTDGLKRENVSFTVAAKAIGATDPDGVGGRPYSTLKEDYAAFTLDTSDESIAKAQAAYIAENGKPIASVRNLLPAIRKLSPKPVSADVATKRATAAVVKAQRDTLKAVSAGTVSEVGANVPAIAFPITVEMARAMGDEALRGQIAILQGALAWRRKHRDAVAAQTGTVAPVIQAQAQAQAERAAAAAVPAPDVATIVAAVMSAMSAPTA